MQTIDAAGAKRFLPGSRVGGGVHKIGPRDAPLYWCEGYATALSVQAALRYLSRWGQVVVCFSAGTLARVARRGIVIADHDESGAGEKAALKTGLPWWMPPEVGDANDWHQAQGLAALARELKGVL